MSGAEYEPAQMVWAASLRGNGRSVDEGPAGYGWWKRPIAPAERSANPRTPRYVPM
jgi:hypothetical protein